MIPPTGAVMLDGGTSLVPPMIVAAAGVTEGVTESLRMSAPVGARVGARTGTWIVEGDGTSICICALLGLHLPAAQKEATTTPVTRREFNATASTIMDIQNCRSLGGSSLASLVDLDRLLRLRDGPLLSLLLLSLLLSRRCPRIF